MNRFIFFSLLLLSFSSLIDTSQAQNYVPASLLRLFAEQHTVELKEFARRSNDCKIHFHTYENEAATLVTTDWICSDWCGSGGCRAQVFATQENTEWKLLYDNTARKIVVKVQKSEFDLDIHVGGVSCDRINADDCVKTAVYRDGVLTLSTKYYSK